MHESSLCRVRTSIMSCTAVGAMLGSMRRKMCSSVNELSCPNFCLQFKDDTLNKQMRTCHLEVFCSLCLSNYIGDCCIPSKASALRL